VRGATAAVIDAPDEARSTKVRLEQALRNAAAPATFARHSSPHLIRNEMLPALRLFVLASAATIASACGTTRDSILFAGKDSSTVRLVASSNARPIANTEVRLRPDSGVGCERARCAADGSMWRGRSDAAGRVVIPKPIIGMLATAEVEAYADDLLDNATLEKNGDWILELTPKDSSGSAPFALKLFDEKTREPFVNQRVTLEFSDMHDTKHNVALTTNAFGYVFIQPQIGAIGKHASLKIPHYNIQFVHFADAHRNLYFDHPSNKWDRDQDP
jgi:hypothetical protein